MTDDRDKLLALAEQRRAPAKMSRIQRVLVLIPTALALSFLCVRATAAEWLTEELAEYLHGGAMMLLSLWAFGALAPIAQDDGR